MSMVSFKNALVLIWRELPCWLRGHDVETEVGTPFCWRCGKKVT